MIGIFHDWKRENSIAEGFRDTLLGVVYVRLHSFFFFFPKPEKRRKAGKEVYGLEMELGGNKGSYFSIPFTKIPYQIVSVSLNETGVL